MSEVWRTIKGFDNYKVSNYGDVMSLNYNHTKKPKKLAKIHDSYGYIVVSLHNATGKKVCKVHRLVAEAFIENKDNKPLINHKDYNRSNNNAKNLEWVDAKENYDYSECHMHKIRNRKTNTGYHHISRDKINGIYRVNFVRHGKKITKGFANLEKAIAYRDEIYEKSTSK